MARWIELCHYTVLGVPNDATAEQIEQAHARLLVRGLGSWKRLFGYGDADIAHAYSVLSNPESRIAYDKDLKAQFAHLLHPPIY